MPAATLPVALAELSRETAASFGTEGTLPQIRTPRLLGEMTVSEALARLLANSGYSARRVGPTAWRIERRQEAPLQARAAPRKEPPAFESEATIVVTGSKRQQPLADLPMALSAVHPDRYHPFDPAAGTSWVSGEVDDLALTNLGPGRNRMFLRGVADSPFNGESQSTVAVVLDDTRLTYAAPDPDIKLIDVDRVEVLKGPQGALYGTGALGGIYHIVTNPPQLQDFSLAASAGNEAIVGGGIGYSTSAVGNFPLLPGRAALRLVGYSTREPGWVDTGDRRNANVSDVVGMRAGLGVDAGDGWRLDLVGFGQWLSSRDSQYVYAPGARSRPAQLPEPHDNDLRHLSGRLAKHSGALDILLSTGLTSHEVDDTLDATLGPEAIAFADPQRLTDDRRYRVWDSEARISGRNGRLEWLIGLSHVSARQERTVALEGASTRSLTINSEHRTIADTAAFGDVTAPLSSALKLSFGARLFHSMVRQSGSLLGAAAADERRRDGITPSASLAWVPRPGRLLFVRYGSAIRQGVIGMGAAARPEPLKDDELATVEAGWREQLPGGHLDVGTYFTWWHDLQSDVLRPDGLIGTQNAGDARIAGIEASLEMRLAPGWTLQSGASAVHSRLVSNALGYPVDDRRLPVVPDFTLRGAIEHAFRIGGASATARMQLRYLGPAHLSFDPTVDRPMGKVLESKVEGRIDFSSWTVAAEIQNVLADSGNTFAFGNSLRFPTKIEASPQRPTSFSLTVAKRFR